MKTTLNTKELESLNACQEGFDKFKKAHGDKAVTLSQALKSNGWNDVWWFISSAYDQFTDGQKHDLRVFGCKKALINIEKIKPYCSTDDYAVIVGYLNSPTESARSAARSAAWSAAESAAESERSAAESAAESARSAAWSAARSAAESAAESAAWSAAMKENEKDLMSLFEKWESENE